DGVLLLEEEIKKLEPGFVVINDMSKCKPIPPRAIAYAKQSQRIIDEAEPSKVIRVVGDMISKMQMAMAGTKSGAAYQAITVGSLEEAYKAADDTESIADGDIEQQDGKEKKGFFASMFGFLKHPE
ncbi:hypothetical protein QUF76_18230, partial [Desulfobacterales bacterium HSG16]|nr:hypothetical protein [Desulfobacterales bacterium HSG16]